MGGTAEIGKGNGLDVLLVMRACAENYPPTVNQANLIARAGLSTGLLDLSRSATTNSIHPSVKRWQPHALWDSTTELPLPFAKRLANRRRFQQAFRELLASERPRIILAYDLLAAAIVPPRPGGYRTIYHFHELPEREPGMRLGTRLSLLQAQRRSPHADLVVFSDSHRAEFFQQSTGLAAKPMVVMNCPLRAGTVPESPLRALLEQRGLGGRKVVCYVGSIGLDKGIGEAVSFMPHWPGDAVLVLIGSCSATVKERILDLAGSANAKERVLFLGQKPHPEAMALVAGADVGISLIQPTKRNSVLSAGAVNKRFEYMSIGLPQVTNSGPGVSELVEKTGCGVCVNPNSPDEIGQAIARLLNDDEARRRMSKNGRRWHLEEFHYERQFEPVLTWIEKAIRETAAAG